LVFSKETGANAGGIENRTSWPKIGEITVTEGGGAGFGAVVFGAAGDWAYAGEAGIRKRLSAPIAIGVVSVEYMAPTLSRNARCGSL
jgi:hypothetical protein